MSPVMTPSCGRPKAITSVARSRPKVFRLSDRMRGVGRNVTLIEARRTRSPARTVETTRRTAAAARTGRGPTASTVTSRPRRGLPLRGDAATGGGVIDAVMVHPRQHPDEFFAHPGELGERERRFRQ